MNQIKDNILIGTDPEYAVIKGDKIVSGIGFVDGNKHQPLILDEELGITRTEDNVLAEFQCPPVNNKEQWMAIHRAMREKGNELLKQYGMSLMAMSSHVYDEDQLQHPNAQTFGCSPSINAWTEEIQYSCGPEDAGNLRSAGFHIHVGTTSEINEEDAYNFVKCCDLFLGVPSVLIDLDTERRKLYGKAGECRINVKGDYIVIEYRTLGGNLLADDDLIAWTYDNMMKALEFYNEGNSNMLPEQEIINCINTCDTEMALKLCNAFDIDYPSIQVDKENVVYFNKNKKQKVEC